MALSVEFVDTFAELVVPLWAQPCFQCMFFSTEKLIRRMENPPVGMGIQGFYRRVIIFGSRILELQPMQNQDIF